jgi:hypothetical protein
LYLLHYWTGYTGGKQTIYLYSLTLTLDCLALVFRERYCAKRIFNCRHDHALKRYVRHVAQELRYHNEFGKVLCLLESKLVQSPS